MLLPLDDLRGAYSAALHVFYVSHLQLRDYFNEAMLEFVTQTGLFARLRGPLFHLFMLVSQNVHLEGAWPYIMLSLPSGG